MLRSPAAPAPWPSPIAGVVGRLAAASLGRQDDRAARGFEQLDRGEADRPADNVDEAGDEQSDAPLLP